MVFIEEALVGPLGAVVRTLGPISGGVVGVSEDKVRFGRDAHEAHTQITASRANS